MQLFDTLLKFWNPPKDEEGSQDAPAGNQATGGEATNLLAIALGEKNFDKAGQIVREQLKTEASRKAVFEWAFKNENLLVMDMVLKSGYQPSPTLKNNQGVSFAEWQQDKSRGGKIEQQLSAKALAQVSAIDIGWTSGMSSQSQSSNLPLPSLLQRGASIMMAC